MEILHHHVVYRRMIRGKRLATLAMVVTSAGAFTAYSHFRNHSVFSRNGTEDKKWFSNLVSKRFKTIKTTVPEAVITSILTHNQHTNKLNETRPGIVSSFETNHFKANNPLEDRHCECVLNFNQSYLFGVFDGHSGWHCSESLRTRLPLYVSLGLMNKELRRKFVSKELKENDVFEYVGLHSEDELENDHMPCLEDKQKAFRTGTNFFVEELDKVEQMGSEYVNETLKYSFLSLDKDIVVEAIPDGVCNDPIWSGLSGAVAITAYIKDNDIYISNTGDCRAVLGKKTSEGHYTDEPLSHDHNADNIAEVKRIKSEHPKEKMVVHQERLLGQLQPLRSFGDVPYKWNEELHRNVLDIIYEHPAVPNSIYLTPPYLTAEPDVKHTKITGNVSFLILATDGLWDFVSNNKAVKIVGSYLEDVKNNVETTENGATRLIRHALGRGNSNRLANMLKIPENIKRNYHDDITVTVIYFNEDYIGVESKL